MKDNYKGFIQYGLALTAGLSLGTTFIPSSLRADWKFNGISLNGVNVNGISLNGIQTNGILLNSVDRIQPNTTTATLAGKSVQEFRVEKGQLVFRLPSTQP